MTTYNAIVFTPEGAEAVEMPNKPNEKHFSGDQWKENQATQAYESAVKEAIANGVRFEDQCGVRTVVFCFLKSGASVIDSTPYHIPNGYRIEVKDGKAKLIKS